MSEESRNLDAIKAGHQRYLTTTEVADILRTSPETCRYWRATGAGPRSFKVGRRVLYAIEDVEAFVAAARRGVGA